MRRNRADAHVFATAEQRFRRRQRTSRLAELERSGNTRREAPPALTLAAIANGASVVDAERRVRRERAFVPAR